MDSLLAYSGAHTLACEISAARFSHLVLSISSLICKPEKERCGYCN